VAPARAPSKKEVREEAKVGQPSRRSLSPGRDRSCDGSGQQFQSPAMKAKRRGSKVCSSKVLKRRRRTVRSAGAYKFATEKTLPRTDTSAQTRRSSWEKVWERRVWEGWSRKPT